MVTLVFFDKLIDRRHKEAIPSKVAAFDRYADGTVVLLIVLDLFKNVKVFSTKSRKNCASNGAIYWGLVPLVQDLFAIYCLQSGLNRCPIEPRRHKDAGRLAQRDPAGRVV